MRYVPTMLAIIAVTATGVARGSIFNDAIGVPVTRIEDNDFEVLVGGNDVIVDQGEFLLSIAEFPTFENAFTNSAFVSSTTATNMVTAVSLIKVASKTDLSGGTGNTFSYTFDAPTPAEWLAETGLAASTGSMILVYDDPASAPANHITNSGLPAGVTSASEGTFQYEFGFTGAGGTAAAGEFWSAITTDSSGGGAADDITNTSITLNFLASLNLLSQGAGTPPLGTHNFLGTVLGLPQFTTPVNLQLQGDLGTQTTGAFDLSTDTDAYISVIPEPTGIVVWGLLASVAGLAVRRKRD